MLFWKNKGLNKLKIKQNCRPPRKCLLFGVPIISYKVTKLHTFGITMDFQTQNICINGINFHEHNFIAGINSWNLKRKNNQYAKILGKSISINLNNQENLAKRQTRLFNLNKLHKTIYFSCLVQKKILRYLFPKYNSFEVLRNAH